MTQRKRASLLIGIHSVDSALTGVPGRLKVIRIAQECRNPRVRVLAERAGEQGIRVEIESRAVLDRRSDGQRHQDIIAEFEAGNCLTEKDLDGLLESLEGPPLLLVLDGVQDPHNLGACLRTADAAGVNLVSLTKDRSAGLTPVARRAASGAAEADDVAPSGETPRAIANPRPRAALAPDHSW